MTIDQVTAPDDPRLVSLSSLLAVTFPDPNSVLGLDRMQEFLTANATEDRTREFFVLVAQRDARVEGGAVFSYVPASNCGFSEYIVVHVSLRGTGLGRMLFDTRKAVLDGAATRHGQVRCEGLFIEVDSPARTPSALLEIERETALDAHERLRIFDHFGFKRVDLAYVQPPLAPDKQPVSYLDLLFAPWRRDAVEANAIPSGTVLDTLAAIWSAWTPETAAGYLQRLAKLTAERPVTLRPLLPAERAE